MTTDKQKQPDIEQSNTVKDPDEWTTGDEPMTGAQRSYLKTLSDEAGEEMDETLTKAEASKKIDVDQKSTFCISFPALAMTSAQDHMEH